ncbi:hypothetical protein GCM10011376_23110 [Nocardioides flavus (ex Wang et al. 2016)]|uniref:Aminoglycoside phosphotransferase domain-containing protein n=1 Tax=Nocardioides flavus (ex Wang et al. 2016) TaxID=2058780 RepID=A0ABQ3HLV7_9ACTN|nr:aminoglycoside phosphotransferase family protein [Nocardioides flavus (ex Wang et al. 2016)]GHE17701.1 hypothetical protein GCM10011376_23110 [Nocardioides flavus (ex Wang et al. 2016)]
MIDVPAALAWAGAEVGASVQGCVRLHGGLTSRMLALRHADGSETVLRLMTNEPWRTHGAELTTRERDAQLAMAGTPVPAPTTLALDAEGAVAGVAAHLMTRLPGAPMTDVDGGSVRAMADLLSTVHAQWPAEPFRTYQSWAWPEKWVVPAWTRHPRAWERAFDVLAAPAPAYAPTFLHRDFGHRNLLWSDGAISGIVDWVETSTGPAWLDAAHAASNLAVMCATALGEDLLEAYAPLAPEPPHPYWLVMDAVGYLPPPGRPPMFRQADQLARLDDWLDHVIRRPSGGTRTPGP